ncbi:hypothetical protein ABTZ58_36075 [Streptomyces sp. NPDC094143]|uniref:hypothetical protein n=1 Tax=Streptomyces sp. NPDC094143 TaxID=3155310 RepID=UPI003332F202
MIGCPVRGPRRPDAFDASLDGIEDSGNQINQALGLANLAAADWFEPFSPDQARDAAGGFRHSCLPASPPDPGPHRISRKAAG